MPNMSSNDADIKSVQELIHDLQNPAPSRQLVKLRKSHKEALRSLDRIFNKATPQGRPSRVVLPDTQWKNQPIIENNQNKTQIPDHEKPPRVPIFEKYPEYFQQVHPVGKPYPEKFQQVHSVKIKP